MVGLGLAAGISPLEVADGVDGDARKRGPSCDVIDPVGEVNSSPGNPVEESIAVDVGQTNPSILKKVSSLKALRRSYKQFSASNSTLCWNSTKQRRRNWSRN